jgi:3-oxoacyl-[acyl-carrier-protein] synthase II
VSELRRRVVVTGIGLVTPVGIGIDETWSALTSGVSGAGPISSFDATGLDVRIAAEVTRFDPLDWLPRREARKLDRFCHFAVAAAELALADSSLPRSTVAPLIGTAIGGGSSIIRGVLAAPAPVSPFFVPSSIINLAAGTVARLHGFTGPSAAPVTACASATDAIGQAFRLVRDGYADAAIAGGAEACIASPLIAGFGNMRALSQRNDDPRAASRPFDAGRDGFVMGEGAGLLLLETAESAAARGSHVYAELAGYGQTNDAYHATAPQPGGDLAARAMTLALKDAGESTVDYINAHGTSTQLSDISETLAIKQVFGSCDLPVSSTKSMTGHLLGATGGVEAAACALAIDTRRLPPTINQDVPDPDCDLDYVPNEARKADVDVAMSNSFAFGGHNSSLVFRRFEG